MLEPLRARVLQVAQACYHSDLMVSTAGNFSARDPETGLIAITPSNHPYDSMKVEDIVVVGHGTTNRAFVQMWLHLPWEWMHKEPNPKNCSIRLIEDGEDKGYIFKGFDGGQHAGQ